MLQATTDTKEQAMTCRRTFPASFLVLALFVAAAGGCREPRTRVLTSEQEQQIRDALLTAAPAPKTPVMASLEGRLRLLGVDVEAKPVKPGETFEVVWYWEALTDLDGDWKAFVHLEKGRKKRTVHDHQPVGELYPFKDFRRGDIVKDVQKIKVADDFPAGEAKVYGGVFDERAWVERQENRRLAVDDPAALKVPIDKEGRLEVGTVTVLKKDGTAAAPRRGEAAEGAKPELRHQVAHKTAEAPVLDGKLDDEVWKKAKPTRSFVQPSGERLGAKRLTQARFAWDDANLYAGVSCKDDDLWNEFKGRDATLWKEDVVEIYLDPGTDGKGYLELQVSPAGEVFDAWFDSRRTPPWEEAAKRLDMAGLVAKVDVQGTVNAREDEVADTGWTVEIAIPWTDLPGVTGPPKDGETWAMNLYRIDAKTPSRGGFTAAWTPAGGDFHNLEAFGRLVFEVDPPKPALVPPMAPLLEATKAAEGARRLIAPGLARPDALPPKPPAPPSVDPHAVPLEAPPAPPAKP